MRILLVTCALLFPMMASADVNKCLTKKYESYSRAKIVYQKQLTKLILTRNPKFESIATIYMNDQLLLIDKNIMAFNHLLRNTPSVLNTTHAINRWIITTPEIDRKIANSNHRYNEILNKIKASKLRPTDPMAGELREIVRNELMLLPEFINLSRALSNSTKDINEISC